MQSLIFLYILLLYRKDGILQYATWRSNSNTYIKGNNNYQTIEILIWNESKWNQRKQAIVQ
jgi:hypothetical protein